MAKSLTGASPWWIARRQVKVLDKGGSAITFHLPFQGRNHQCDIGPYESSCQMASESTEQFQYSAWMCGTTDRPHYREMCSYRRLRQETKAKQGQVHSTYACSFKKHFVGYLLSASKHDCQTDPREDVGVVALSGTICLARVSDCLKRTSACKYAPTLHRHRSQTGLEKPWFAKNFRFI